MSHTIGKTLGMSVKEVMNMDADEFYNWAAYLMIENDYELKKNLIEQSKLDSFTPAEREAYLIRRVFEGI